MSETKVAKTKEESLKNKIKIGVAGKLPAEDKQYLIFVQREEGNAVVYAQPRVRKQPMTEAEKAEKKAKHDAEVKARKEARSAETKAEKERKKAKRKVESEAKKVKELAKKKEKWADQVKLNATLTKEIETLESKLSDVRKDIVKRAKEMKSNDSNYEKANELQKEIDSKRALKKVVPKKYR